MKRNKLDTIVSYLIPPSLVLLLIMTIAELFYGLSKGWLLFIDIFDLYVVIIFAIDLYFRWQETPKFIPYIRKHFLDIIATIPFNLIFWGIRGLALIKALRGVKLIARAARALRLARYTRLLRLLRFGARTPRFLRTRKHIKETKIRKVQPHEKEMKKTLGFKVILLITINSIMGTGIWFLTSAGAKHAGPASLISWGVLALISIYISMCFGELASMFPKAGGVYEFAKQTYGRFWSFVIGWTTSIAGSVTIAMLMLGALQYIVPTQWSNLNVPIAIALIVIFNYVAFRGMQTSTYMLVTFALITLGTVAAILIPGVINFEPGNFVPFFVFPSLSIILAIFFIAETFFGWESAIFLSAETKNPSKIMPKALVYGTIVIALLAFLLAGTSMGIIPWDKFAESAAPLRDLGGVHFGTVGAIIFTVLVFVSIIGAVASWIVTAPRLLMAIAEDKLFFTQFAKIHPKHKSPYVSIAFQVVVISILVVVGAGRYETLLHMLIPLILVVYSAVLLSVVILRFKKPHQKRPYKVVFGKVGPFVTIIFMLFLLFMFIRETHGAMDILRISGSLILFGIPAYFFIELFYEPKYVALRKNLLAHLKHNYNKIPLPASLFNKILSLVGPFGKDSVIMAYNYPLGSFTNMILKKEHPYRKIHLANQSQEELKVFNKTLPFHDKRKIETHFLKTLRVPSVSGVSSFVSFNALGLVGDVPKFVHDVRMILRKKGKYCFYVKNHLLNMSRNSVLLEDRKKITALFRKERLKVSYMRKRRIFTDEIFIYGWKR